MAPFSMPAPCIVPLRIPVLGMSRNIDTSTLIEISCDTILDHEIFYTLDGTRPQPYAGIVQGSKLHKYKSPIYLPSGKITIKAIAVNALVHTMRSNVITKTYEVVKSKAQPAVLKSKVEKRREKAPKKPIMSENLDEEYFVTKDLDRLNLEERLKSTFEVSVSEQSSDQADSADEMKESLSEICSIISEPEIKADKIDPDDIKDNDEAFTSNNYIITSTKLPNKDDDLDHAYSADTIDLCCIRCETMLVHCKECNRPSAITSKYCYQCGKRLLSACKFCKELNSIAATYCQSCGEKLSSEEFENEVNYIDCSTMAEPLTTHASVQLSLNMVDKASQTAKFSKSPSNRSKSLSLDQKIMPSHSPGRGYWHQQLDYICNHIKSFAYNDLEFREAISKPVLSEFKSASVNKDSDKISITFVFSRLELEKGENNKGKKMKDVLACS